MNSGYILIIAEATICMVIINLVAYAVSRRGLVTKILITTSPTVATSFILGMMFANLGFNKTTGLAFFIISLIVGIGFVWAVFTWVINPINKVTQVSDRIAQGDLVQQIDQKNRDEVGHMLNSIQSMIAYLQNMAKIAAKIAEGDLMSQVDPRSKDDHLANTFNQMIQNLRLLTSQIKDGADGLANTSLKLANVADEAGAATSEVIDTIQQVALGLQQQTESVQSTAKSISQLSQAIQSITQGAHQQEAALLQSSNITAQISAAMDQVSANVQLSAASATQAAKTAIEGATTINKTIADMDQIKLNFGISTKKVQQMSHLNQKVSHIVGIINDIAAETNLLALNASIEAARAGGQGKGFKVVAAEVQKLAKRTAVEAKEINSLLQSIQKAVVETHHAMQEGAVIVDNGAKHANTARYALADILKSAETVNKQVSNIAATVEQINNASNEIAGSMGSLSTVVKQNSIAVEEMMGSSQIVSKAMKQIAFTSEKNNDAVVKMNLASRALDTQAREVTELAQALSRFAKDQQLLVTQFKLN